MQCHETFAICSTYVEPTLGKKAVNSIANWQKNSKTKKKCLVSFKVPQI